MSNNPNGSKSWQVLVVEDEFDSLQMVSKVLSHHHIQIRTARNGVECLQILEDFEPTLIIMDLAMPEMNGWETLVEIRSNSTTAHIPVVAITAYGSPNVASDAIQAGFDAYFPKPVHPVRFVQELAGVIGE